MQYYSFNIVLSLFHLPHIRVSTYLINKNIPWVFFDRASQGTPSRGWVGGIISVSTNHTISFKSRTGHAKNNFSELMGLKKGPHTIPQKRSFTYSNSHRLTFSHSRNERIIHPMKFYVADFILGYKEFANNFHSSLLFSCSQR